MRKAKRRGIDLKAYSRGYLLRREREGRAIIAEAMDKPCADCGRRQEKMLLVYTRGEKEFNIQTGIGPARLRAEIQKCDLLCEECRARRG